MAKYIDKSALVAELERAIDGPAPSHDQQCPWEDGYYCGLYKAESILDTLEVKEVDEEYNGKAMLHVLEKGVKQGKRELIDRACEWLRKELVNFEDYSGMGEELISDFRKAMEE